MESWLLDGGACAHLTMITLTLIVIQMQVRAQGMIIMLRADMLVHLKSVLFLMEVCLSYYDYLTHYN